MIEGSIKDKKNPFEKSNLIRALEKPNKKEN